MRSAAPLLLSAAVLAWGAGCSEPSGRARPTDAAPPETPAPPEAPAPLEVADESADETDIDEVPWSTSPSVVGAGIAYKNTRHPSNRGVAVLYAGYRVDLAGAEAWATALYRAALRERGIRHIFAVQGPATSNYAGREIGNSSIAGALERMVAAGVPRVLVVGHSSGSFVAHELLGKLTNATASKVVYFDLDGGTAGLSNAGASRLHRAWFVGVRDGDTKTTGFNGNVMKHFGARYSGATFLEIDASGSGCNAGATECVHMAIVNARPHDPSTADVETDYHLFDDDHPVQTGWLDAKGDDSGIVPEL